MKNLFCILFISLCASGISTKAQDTIYVHQKNGLIMKIALDLIDSIVFYNSPSAEPSLIDGDGNQYTSVIIGTQTWMVENLKTTKYNNGLEIPLVTDNEEWRNLTSGAYCWHDNDSLTYKEPYGAFYNWYAVETGNLCPTGWRVPSDTDWTILIDYLGGETVAGGKMKEIGTIHWTNPNEGATNESGFTALPGSTRWYDGQFPSIGTRGSWWGSVEVGACCGFNVYILHDSSSAVKYDADKEAGSSVRCVKN